MKNVPTTLVVGFKEFVLNQEKANSLVKDDLLYIDDSGESKPRRAHLHINPERRFSLSQLEEIIFAIEDV